MDLDEFKLLRKIELNTRVTAYGVIFIAAAGSGIILGMVSRLVF